MADPWKVRDTAEGENPSSVRPWRLGRPTEAPIAAVVETPISWAPQDERRSMPRDSQRTANLPSRMVQIT